MSAEYDPKNGESECIEYLITEIEPVALVALARREQQFDTTYDHFLYDYVGDPQFIRQPAIEQHYPLIGERNYTERLLASYSQEGSLVHVRSVRQSNPQNRTYDFFVVSADLHRQTITEWHVTEANFSGAGDSLRLELLLSDKPLEGIQTERSLEEHDPLRRIIEQKRMLARHEEEQANQPRVVLTSQGCWFSRGANQLEPLAPIGELVRKVDALYTRFGHVALLHAEEPQTEPADTIAA